MTKRVFDDIDFQGVSRIVNALIDPRTTDPSLASLRAGMLWFNATENRLKYYDGTTVSTLASISDTQDPENTHLLDGSVTEVKLSDQVRGKLEASNKTAEVTISGAILTLTVTDTNGTVSTTHVTIPDLYPQILNTKSGFISSGLNDHSAGEVVLLDADGSLFQETDGFVWADLHTVQMPFAGALPGVNPSLPGVVTDAVDFTPVLDRAVQGATLQVEMAFDSTNKATYIVESTTKHTNYYSLVMGKQIQATGSGKRISSNLDILCTLNPYKLAVKDILNPGDLLHTDETLTGEGTTSVPLALADKYKNKGIRTVWYSIKRKYVSSIDPANTEHEAIIDQEVNATENLTDRDGNTFDKANLHYVIMETGGETVPENEYLKFGTKIGSKFTVVRGDRYLTGTITHVIIGVPGSQDAVVIYYTTDATMSDGENNRSNAPYIGWQTDSGGTDLTINFDSPGVAAADVYTPGGLVTGDTDLAPTGAVAKVNNELKRWPLTDMRFHIIGPSESEVTLGIFAYSTNLPNSQGLIRISGPLSGRYTINITWINTQQENHLGNFVKVGQRLKINNWEVEIPSASIINKNSIAYGGLAFDVETVSGTPPSSGNITVKFLGDLVHYDELFNEVKKIIKGGTDLSIVANDTDKTLTIQHASVRSSPYHYAQIITNENSPYHHPTPPAAGTADTNSETNLTRKLHLPSTSQSTTNGKMSFTLLQKHATSGTLNEEVFQAILSGQIWTRLTTGSTAYPWVGLEMIHYFDIGGSSVGIPKTRWARIPYSAQGTVDIELNRFSTDLKLSTFNIPSQYLNNPCTHTEYKLHLWFYSGSGQPVPIDKTLDTNASNYKLQDKTLNDTEHLFSGTVTINGFTLSDCEIGYFQLKQIY